MQPVQHCALRTSGRGTIGCAVIGVIVALVASVVVRVLTGVVLAQARPILAALPARPGGSATRRRSTARGSAPRATAHYPPVPVQTPQEQNSSGWHWMPQPPQLRASQFVSMH